MTWQKVKVPKLSKEAQEFDKRLASPNQRPTRAKQGPVTYHTPKCSECDDAELFEDVQNGNLVCRQCGLCEQMIIPEEFNWADVDWQGSSLVQKSQHQPGRYFLDLLRKFDISEHLVPELTRRYKAVHYWAERCRPDGRKSLPSYRK
jgi:transcription elongation factor Elf1